jgi:hypothetical protein
MNIQPHSMWKPKKRGTSASIWGGSWKVTSRYTVHQVSGQPIDVVRISQGQGSYHMTVELFLREFRPQTEQEAEEKSQGGVARDARRETFVNRLHIEALALRRVLFSIEPALCGRRRPVDYRVFPPDDADHRRAARPFFAGSIREATCRACVRLEVIRRRQVR